ncbi:MAG: tetratricopeptide repeat protein [Phycisphaerales bacterium]
MPFPARRLFRAPARPLTALPAKAKAKASTHAAPGRPGLGLPLALGLGALTLLPLGGCNNGQRPIQLIRTDADRAFFDGDFDIAAAEYRQIIDRYPGDWRAQYQYGKSSLELGDFESARVALKVANDRRPADSQIADAYAEAMFRAGDETSLLAFLRDRTIEERSAHAWVRLADYQRRLGDPDGALQAIETGIEIGGGEKAEPYMAAARLAESLGDRQTALMRLEQAYQAEPGDAEVEAAIRALGQVPGPTFRGDGMPPAMEGMDVDVDLGMDRPEAPARRPMMQPTTRPTIRPATQPGTAPANPPATTPADVPPPAAARPAARPVTRPSDDGQSDDLFGTFRRLHPGN